MKFIFALLLFLISSSTALADQYGPFLCTSGCTFAGNIGVLPDGETHLFIGEVVNNYDDGQYEVGDTVVICNGSICATYRFSGFAFRLVTRTTDNGGPYRNQTPPTGGGGGAFFNGGGTVSGGYGIIGFRAVTRTGQTCSQGVCTTTTIVVYEPIYGYYTTVEP
jgi:hypothetical protein